jgi:hypothetical protein
MPAILRRDCQSTRLLDAGRRRRVRSPLKLPSEQQERCRCHPLIVHACLAGLIVKLGPCEGVDTKLILSSSSSSSSLWEDFHFEVRYALLALLDRWAHEY